MLCAYINILFLTLKLKKININNNHEKFIKQFEIALYKIVGTFTYIYNCNYVIMRKNLIEKL